MRHRQTNQLKHQKPTEVRFNPRLILQSIQLAKVTLKTQYF